MIVCGEVCKITSVAANVAVGQLLYATIRANLDLSCSLFQLPQRRIPENAIT